jgi:hypothetical protein
MKDPNVIQIRDEFYLAKRQYELQPELLGDLTVRSLYHSLMNIRTIAQLEQWLETIEKSDYSYDSQTEISDTEYGNILGEIAHTASELNKEQRQEAVKVFKTLGPVKVLKFYEKDESFLKKVTSCSNFIDDDIIIKCNLKHRLYSLFYFSKSVKQQLSADFDEEYNALFYNWVALFIQSSK